MTYRPLRSSTQHPLHLGKISLKLFDGLEVFDNVMPLEESIDFIARHAQTLSQGSVRQLALAIHLHKCSFFCSTIDIRHDARQVITNIIRQIESNCGHREQTPKNLREVYRRLFSCQGPDALRKGPAHLRPPVQSPTCSSV